MRILRPFILCGTTVLSAAVVCFVAADRVTHSSYRAPPSMTIAKLVQQAPEPETTGTVTQGTEIAQPKPASTLDGFDTERLNALMRGEVLPAPVAKPKAIASARKRQG